MATNNLSPKSWIRKTPEVSRGAACIRETCIAVWKLVNDRRLGIPEEELLTRYEEPLTQDDLNAAWEYYRKNQDEIDRAIQWAQGI